MVKMRFLFVGSVCLHGLLALSIGQYVVSQKHRTSSSFSVVLLSSSKASDLAKASDSASQKIGYRQIKKVTSSKTSHPMVQTSSVPAAIYNPSPNYPAIAKASGEEGVFSVKILVSANGKVEHVEVVTLKGKKELFEEELLSTLKTWQFNSCEKEVSFEIPISFQLD